MSPRPTRRPGPPSFYLGVWGGGDTTTENIKALLDDFIEGLGRVTPKFVVPLEKDLSTEAILDVAQYALDNDYELHVVYEKKPATKVLKEFLVAASKEITAEEADGDSVPFEPTESAIADTLVQAISDKPEQARLLFLWNAEGKDSEVEDDERVLYAAVDSGVAVLDLTSGLDALGADPPAEDETGEGDPEDKTSTPDGDDGDGGDMEPYETAKEWPVRRLKSYAKEIAAADRDEGVEGALDDSEIDEMGKDDILSYLYPERGQGKAKDEPEPESEEPEDPEKGITPKRARQMREEIEKDRTKGSTRKAAAAKEEPSEGDAAGEGLTSLIEALVALGEAQDNEEVADALANAAEAFADILIDRIAARVEREPEGSPVRKEVAPPRPPGKPKADGSAPTRRRTARA